MRCYSVLLCFHPTPHTAWHTRCNYVPPPSLRFSPHRSSTEMLQQQLIPLFELAAGYTSSAYTVPWAPHHLGTWPFASIGEGVVMTLVYVAPRQLC